MARRAAVNLETLAFLDADIDPAFVTSRPESEVFGTRYYHHIRRPSPDGFAEVCLIIGIFVYLLQRPIFFSVNCHSSFYGFYDLSY